MLKKIGLGLGAIVVALVIVIAMQPAAFSIERSATIEAPADIVYGSIHDLRAMDAWLPFGTRADPELRNTYEGPASGVGAVVSWEGPKAGKGRTTITAVKPDREVEMTVEYFEPMRATNDVRFTLAPAGDATTVTWRIRGTNGFVGKAFSLFANMDEVVGTAFEQGLASMKSLAEAETTRAYNP